MEILFCSLRIATPSPSNTYDFPSIAMALEMYLLFLSEESALFAHDVVA
jgi:hypothetical protein